MTFTLGDAFSRRKQIESELQNWINRLRLAGRDSIKYQTKEIEGDKKFIKIPGSEKNYKRTYTIEECQGECSGAISFLCHCGHNTHRMLVTIYVFLIKLAT